jgi:hypothetical protein
MSEFQRPKAGFRFEFGGLNTKDVPSALPPNKYTCAVNLRSTADKAIRTRPGYLPRFSTGNYAITDIRGYTVLNTDAFPRFLARDAVSTIWLDNGNAVANLAQPAGWGVSMIPFRPSESPNSWMYIGSQSDYQKLSAPDANNNVIAYKVGIMEPQQTLNAAPQTPLWTPFTNSANNWNNGGNAGAPSAGSRSNDTLGPCFQDPAQTNRYYARVGNNANASYAIGEILAITGSNNNASPWVQDIFPALGANLTIESIHYAAGNNGACVITPSQLPIGTGFPGVGSLSQLRRGSIMQIGGNETVLVLGVINGPNGSVAFQTTTANTWAANANLVSYPSIAIDSGGTVFGAGQTAISAQIGSNLNTGIGTITQNLSPNPFITGFTSPSNNSTIPQQDDYIHCSVSVSDPTQLLQALLLFNIDGNNFTSNVLYYAIAPSAFASVLNGNNTVLASILESAENTIIGSLAPEGQGVPASSATGNNQWVELMFPISGLTRIGNDQTKTLANCNAVQFQFNVANNISVAFGSLWVGGGGQPDVGNNGAPYQYQCVPLSSLTGARGNPTRDMRYGVTPQRQPVILKTSNLNAAYDPQIDTWEVYRYGGSITSYRFIGTVPIGSDFIDDYFDDTAQDGNAIVTDNTEPWPSIDAPWKVTGNNATSITAFGNLLVVSGYSAWPATINRWLPGTEFQVGGSSAYTLRSRPTQQNNTSYLFEMEQCIGSGNQTSLLVLEPNVARQTLPYLWGPDAYGTIFGVGDPLRPGVVSFTKQYTPDASPTAYTQDVCPPSEPLIAGQVIAGVSVVASSRRWWQLQFQQGNVDTPYIPIEMPMGKRLAAPFGLFTDGAMLFFWSDEGICAGSAQGGAKSLTDADLYNLFPHAGQTGINVQRYGQTFYSPDYSRAETFRLSGRDGYLFADYEDTNGLPHTLVYDIRNNAWVADQYANAITVHYGIEDQPGSLESAPNTYPRVLMGDTTGKVWYVVDRNGDNGTPIPVVIGTFEYDAGDVRSGELWGDAFLDSLPLVQLTVQPTSGGFLIGTPVLIPASTQEQYSPISLGGGVLAQSLGLAIGYLDTLQATIPVTLYSWQPSVAEQVETTADRASDWTNCGTADNKFFQGIKLDADTFNAPKQLLIQDADTGQTHVLQPSPIQHNGRQTLPYSFATPFIAHMVKDVPQDLVRWRKFGIEYIFEPTPEMVQSWITQWTAHGMKGYQHVARIEAAYASTTPITLALKSYDGQSPNAITLAPTAGIYQKQLLTLTFNKGQLYQYSATSTAGFQLFLNDWIVWVGEWGRNAPYTPYRILGGQFGDKARI